jgi:hypothetical protein
MRLYSYIVARDYGFAPNPFHGYCTLATCKPKIRAGANPGDWIVGTGAKTRYDLAGHLIFAMQVAEVMGYDAFWNDPRFLAKRPVLNGSLKVMYGDNIYHRVGRRWAQKDSHHSLENGRPNRSNVEHDTSVDRLLVATKFVYWGRSAPRIPRRFRPFRKTDEDVCCKARGYRVFSQELAEAFPVWVEQLGKWGFQGEPLEFAMHKRVAKAVGTAGAASAGRARQRSAARSTR